MSPEEAARWYERSASELKDLGFNVDLGPVVDLSVNHDSRVISGLGRSFGADPDIVTEFARIFIESFHKFGLLTAIKHFPGHGSTPFDSHAQLPDITDTWSEKELIPFAKLAGATDMIMAGHLVHAQLTGPGTPATLSAMAIIGLLREKLGFKGPVITDDMQMEAIGEHYGADESIVRGIEGGADLFIFTNHDHPDAEMPERFIRVARGAVESGRIAASRIDESFERIKRLKARLGCAANPNGASTR
jgi:beta-N-acetylhexosaminidase